MRNYENLKAFQLADQLALKTYVLTRGLPPEERYGLAAQLRKCAVSVASNIVEGCARHSEADFLRFLDIAFGSVRELGYQLSLARRLTLIEAHDAVNVEELCCETGKVLGGLIRAIRRRGPDPSLLILATDYGLRTGIYVHPVVTRTKNAFRYLVSGIAG